MSRSHFSDYDQVTTERCERALLTLLGDIGPWRERIYLAGGLAPRYLTGVLPEGAPGHVGTTDVDVIIGLAVADEAPETYRTLTPRVSALSSWWRCSVRYSACSSPAVMVSPAQGAAC